MIEKYWKTGNEVYIGVPYGNAIELTWEEYSVFARVDLINLVKSRREEKISNVEWRKGRHYDEVALGLEPTEEILPILRYIQDLRDIPQQESFPENIVWPIPPWEEEVIND